MKYFVISQPKAGTYLAANLLTEFGISFEGLHFSLKSYQQYDLKKLEEARINRKKYTYIKHISESIKLIGDNCLGVGHLEYSQELEDLLKGFKKILLVRDITTTKESWKHWATITKKSSQSKLIEDTFRKNISKWQNREDVFTLNFYDMKNSNLIKINELQHFLFQDTKFNSKKAILNALSKDSLTKVIRK